jgi:hypothetical protein
VECPWPWATWPLTWKKLLCVEHVVFEDGDIEETPEQPVVQLAWKTAILIPSGVRMYRLVCSILYRSKIESGAWPAVSSCQAARLYSLISPFSMDFRRIRWTSRLTAVTRGTSHW